MTRQDDQLGEYRRKRDFAKTSEPAGRKVGRSARRPRFVVQLHDATSLHFDFRLEADGVLKSWAVPKGPSLDPAQRRLAVATEDHPLQYRDFEGVIAEGEYGAGTVLLWDAGTYRNTSEHEGHPVPIGEALGSGHATVWLHGRKLNGGFALVRMHGRGKQTWLLIKQDDEHADTRAHPAKSRRESVRTGRTLREVADGAPARRQARKPTPPAKKTAAKKAASAGRGREPSAGRRR